MKKVLIIIAIAFIALISMAIVTAPETEMTGTIYEEEIVVEDWMTKTFVVEDSIKVEDWMTKPFNI